MKKQSVKFSMARLENKQRAIEDGYKKRFGLTDEQVGQLHMFFSPIVVSKRLKRWQVAICLVLPELSPMQRAYLHGIKHSWPENMTDEAFSKPSKIMALLRQEIRMKSQPILNSDYSINIMRWWIIPSAALFLL